jgi:hypothetical protein
MVHEAVRRHLEYLSEYQPSEPSEIEAVALYGGEQ